MNPTPTKYFGDAKTYNPKTNIPESYQEMPNYLADVIFEELLNNKAFLLEAKEAMSKLVKDPKQYPNLSVRYKNFIEK